MSQSALFPSNEIGSLLKQLSTSGKETKESLKELSIKQKDFKPKGF